MSQGKSDVVKQETARVNINILGISKLKWTKMGKLNSDDHYIYYCGQESCRRNGVALIVNKSLKNAVLGFISKANHSTPQKSKSMPQSLMSKKLNLNSSMKTYKTS